MRTDDFFEALGELDDSLIINARNTPDNPVKIKLERRSWKPFAAAAACVVALVAVAALNFVKIADHVKSAKTNDGYPKDAIYQYTGDFSELEPCFYQVLCYYRDCDFRALANESKLIVTGTFVDDARQTEPVKGEVQCDLNTSSDFGMSYNKFRVDEVFKGDVSVGDELIIGDKYFVNGGNLNYYHEATLTPMIKGDRWVYFLSVDNNGYYNAIDLGRYPIPGEEHPFVLAGAYDHLKFRDEIYEDVKIMLGHIEGVQKLDPGDKWGNYEFTMPDFLGETFVWRDKDLYVLNGGSETARTLYGAPGIMSIYLADLNGDGKREIISECWNGASGLSASYITVYDYANSKLYGYGSGSDDSYLISDRLEIRDGVLYAVREGLGGIGELSAAPFKFEDLEEVTITEPETIEYNGKTYMITNKTIRDGEVSVSIGLTQLEYQTGDLIEVLAMVHNYTDKPIKLQMPVQGENSHTEVEVTLKQGEAELYEYFGDGVIRIFNDAIGYHTIEPGDTYYQEMRFDTHKQRFDPENTLIPLYKPLGAYEGLAGIRWYSADDDMRDEPNRDQVGFSVNIVDRIGVGEGKFTMDEFPNVEFSYHSYMISAKESVTDKKLFSCISIDSLYLADLNGDGKRELCASVTYKSRSGITDERILVYDYANKKLYELSDNGNYDYRIMVYKFAEEWYLRAVKCEYMTGFELYDEPLTLDIMKEVEKPSEESNPVVNGVTKAGGIKIVGDHTSKFRMPEYLGDQFFCGELSTYVQHEDCSTSVMFTGAVDALYLADINGDGKREFIAVFYEYADEYFLIAGGEIRVYDYANDKLYYKASDISFSLDEKDNKPVIYYNYSTPEEPLTLDILTEIAKKITY